MSNKVELKEKEMDRVMGGVAYSDITMTIGEDYNHMNYHFKDIDAIFAYYDAHEAEYDTVDGLNKGIIAGLLKEGLIW